MVSSGDVLSVHACRTRHAQVHFSVILNLEGYCAVSLDSSMCSTLGRILFAGCLHPDRDGYFESPAQYMAWYRRRGPLRDSKDAPVVAVLLYRCSCRSLATTSLVACCPASALPCISAPAQTPANC